MFRARKAFEIYQCKECGEYQEYNGVAVGDDDHLSACISCRSLESLKQIELPYIVQKEVPDIGPACYVVYLDGDDEKPGIPFRTRDEALDRCDELNIEYVNTKLTTTGGGK